MFFQFIYLFSSIATDVLSGRRSSYSCHMENYERAVSSDTLYAWEHTCIDYIVEWFGLTHETPDNNGLYNGLVTPQCHADYVMYISATCIPVGAFAIYRGYYDLACVPLGVFATSINYWRLPVYGVRRNLDLVCVFTGMSWQIYRAYTAEYGVWYYTLLFVAVLFFPLSWRVHSKCAWLATFLHSMVHIVGNISNVVLYAGEVQPNYFTKNDAILTDQYS